MSASVAEEGGEEDLSHACEIVLEPSRWKGNKKSAIWKYFSHIDANVHPDLKTWRVCLVCRREGIDKALNCSESATTGCLIEHLKRHHSKEFEQFQKERDEKLKMKKDKEEDLKDEPPKERPSSPTKVSKPRGPRGPYKKKRSASEMETGTSSSAPSTSNKVPLVRLAADPKSSMQKLEEELDRLMKLQKMAEDRLDDISMKLEAGRSKFSPFDIALLQDRKDSAVKNVQSIGKKVDSLCDKLNGQGSHAVL